MDGISGDLNAPHSMGTTIIGVTYDGGVVLGADSRTSTGNCFWPTKYYILECRVSFFSSDLVCHDIAKSYSSINCRDVCGE